MAVIVIPLQAQTFNHTSKSYTVYNNENKRVKAPVTTYPSQTIYIVDDISYLPAKDDDFNFEIIDLRDGTFRVKTKNGNGSSKLSFSINTWRLPKYVKWQEFNIELKGKEDYEVRSWDVPKYHSGFPIIEVLSYMSEGDDDASYFIDAKAIGNTIVICAFSAFGRNESRMNFRVRILYWPAEKPSTVDIEKIVIRNNMKKTRSYSLLSGNAYLAVPTAYWAKNCETLEAKYEDAIRKVMGSKDPRISLRGLVINTPYGTIDIGPKELYHVYVWIKGLFSDDCDDDFWIKISYAWRGWFSSLLEFSMGDGNKYSQADLLFYTVKFPSSTASDEVSPESPEMVVHKEPANGIASNFCLFQNYPNPFNPSTTIKFSLGCNEHVVLKVYNNLGQEVVTLIDGEYFAGNHEINWNAKDLPGGVYFCQIKVGTFVETRKMILMK